MNERAVAPTEQYDSSSPQFQVVRPARMSDAVVRQLVEAAARGGLAVGEPLPSESDLVEQFGVSRTVIRDALKVLEEKGIINVQQGRRTTVLSRDHWNILDPDIIGVLMEHEEGLRLFDELITVRLALECTMAEQAAARITADELAALRACLETMDMSLDDPERFLEADIAFHERIMSASGNRVARAVLRSIQEPLRLTRRVTNRVPNGIPRAQAYHEAIFRVLAGRDSEGARQAMQEHLLWTRDVWLASQEAHELAGGDGSKRSDVIASLS